MGPTVQLIHHSFPRIITLARIPCVTMGCERVTTHNTISPFDIPLCSTVVIEAILPACEKILGLRWHPGRFDGGEFEEWISQIGPAMLSLRTLHFGCSYSLPDFRFVTPYLINLETLHWNHWNHGVSFLVSRVAGWDSF